MNAESSRSHLICSLVVKLANRRTGTEVIGKLTLVDLAGSEVNDNNLIIFTLKAFIFFLSDQLSFHIVNLTFIITFTFLVSNI